MVQWVPYTGSEKESLQASLNRHRDAVVWKLQGLDDTELRRTMLPSGNTLLGLVKHLAIWEYIWICRTFGYPTEQLPIEEGDDYADVRIDPGDSTAGILAFYSRSRAAADQVSSRPGDRWCRPRRGWHHDVRRYGLAAVGRDRHARRHRPACRARRRHARTH